jgi:hypothetical protein
VTPRTRPALALAPAGDDQVKRLALFRAAHPEVRVSAISRQAWQAIIPELDGETVITRRDLKDLLDRAEVMVAGT